MKARLPKEYSGKGMGNMNDMIKQAQKMQEDMKNLQAELDEREFEVKAGGGAVTVVMTGKKRLQSIALSPEIVDPDDIEMLQDIIVAAVNEAASTVDDTVESEMGRLTGGLNIPGLV